MPVVANDGSSAALSRPRSPSEHTAAAMFPAALTAPFAATLWNVPPFSSTRRSPPGSTLTAVGAVNDPTSESVNPAGTASAGDADGIATRKPAASNAPVTIDLNIDLVR